MSRLRAMPPCIASSATTIVGPVGRVQGGTMRQVGTTAVIVSTAKLSYLRLCALPIGRARPRAPVIRGHYFKVSLLRV